MKSILLLGRNGQVGWELQHSLLPLGRVTATDRTQLDLTQPDRLRTVIREIAPDIIVNAAGYTTVDQAESERDLAMQINAIAPEVMAEEAKRSGALLVHYSTDYVFDGRKAAPYSETDEPHPLNHYGKSKLDGEIAITAIGGAYLILRASWIYSARGSNFVLTMLRLARQRKEIAVVNDQIGSPTWARELAADTASVICGFRERAIHSGIYHLSAVDSTSRHAFAKEIVDFASGLSDDTETWATVNETTTSEYPLPAARPLNAATSKDKIQRAFGLKLSGWKSQLHAFLREHLANAMPNRPS
jgi:dTDP-4-dehydrorhamnose reductase